MVRSELIIKLARIHLGVKKKDLEKVVDIIIEEITAALKRGERIQLRGFGTMRTVFRKARIARNPRTNQQIQIESRTGVRFKMGKDMFQRLNKK